MCNRAQTADSKFWQELGARFVALKIAMQADSWLKIKAVRASDNSVTPPMERWDLQANDRGFQIRFEAIAETGGDALSPDDSGDPLYAWLNALVRESHATGINRKLNVNGFELDNLIEASINLCAREVGESVSRVLPALFALQLLPRASLVARDSSNGSRNHRSYLGTQ